jgi:PAP2 superfamily protein
MEVFGMKVFYRFNTFAIPIYILLLLPKFIFSSPLNDILEDKDSTNVNIRVNTLNTVIHTYLSDSWKILVAPTKMQKKHIIPIAGIAATAGLLYYFDPDITEAFDRSEGNALYDRLIKTGEGMEPMGQIERMNPYCMGGFVLGYFVKSPKMQTASFQILESLAIASGYKTIIREVFGRARPSEKLGPRYFKFMKGESFPSGHTSNAFQVATILSYHVDWLPFTIASYGLATTIGLQRIDANLHWSSDVFMGAVYGTAVSRLLLRLHENRTISVLPYYRADENLLGLSIHW